MKVKLLHPDAQVPVRKTDGSAGYDLFAVDTTYVQPNSIHPKEVNLGFAIEIPKKCVGLIYVRSSRGKKGLYLANGTGVIDSDYRGEIRLQIKNHSPESYQIKKGEAIAQLVIVPYRHPNISVVKNLETTKRGEGGFGSTDRESK